MYTPFPAHTLPHTHYTGSHMVPLHTVPHTAHSWTTYTFLGHTYYTEPHILPGSHSSTQFTHMDSGSLSVLQQPPPRFTTTPTGSVIVQVPSPHMVLLWFLHGSSSSHGQLPLTTPFGSCLPTHTHIPMDPFLLPYPSHTHTFLHATGSTLHLTLVHTYCLHTHLVRSRPTYFLGLVWTVWVPLHMVPLVYIWFTHSGSFTGSYQQHLHFTHVLTVLGSGSHGIFLPPSAPQLDPSWTPSLVPL